MEPRPGPPRKRLAPSNDLLQADVLPSTAARYSATLLEFEHFRAVRDIPGVSCLAQAALPCLVDWTALPQSFLPQRGGYTLLSATCPIPRPVSPSFGGFTFPGPWLFQASSGRLCHTTSCLPSRSRAGSWVGQRSAFSRSSPSAVSCVPQKSVLSGGMTCTASQQPSNDGTLESSVLSASAVRRRDVFQVTPQTNSYWLTGRSRCGPCGSE